MRQLNMLPELVDDARKRSGVLKGVKEITNVQTLADILNASPVADMFSEVVKLLKIFLTIPVTTASAERSFSALRRLKTYLRATMTQTRLSNVMVLHCHKDFTDKINLKNVAKQFVQVNDRRKNFLGAYD